jgi:hypothetical protein
MTKPQKLQVAGSKPARGTPFASWQQQIHVHIGLNEEAQTSGC